MATASKSKERNAKASGPGIFKKNIEPLLDGLTRSVMGSPLIKAQLEHEMLSGWKKAGYEKNAKSVLLTITVTNRCTLRCGHCFEEAGPEKNDFLDAARMDRLAEESIGLFKGYTGGELRITGGDPFLHPDIFKIIKSFSSRKEKIGYSTLDVETNGWWASDGGKTSDVVLNLKKAGATLLSMTRDNWHKRGNEFQNDEHFGRIDKCSKIVGLEFRPISVAFPVEVNGELVPQATPIGRGRELPEEYWGDHWQCNSRGCRLTPPTQAIAPGYAHRDEITIGPGGNVYPCNSGKAFEHASLALGNIYEKPLNEIVKAENSIVKMIKDRGLRSLTKIIGMSVKEHWKMYGKFSPCGLCHEMLRKHGKEITERLQKDQKGIHRELNKEIRALGIINTPVAWIFGRRIIERMPKILRMSNGNPLK